MDNNALWAVLSPTIWWICEVFMGARTFTYNKRSMENLWRLTVKAKKQNPAETLRAAIYALSEGVKQGRLSRDHLKLRYEDGEEQNYRFDAQTVKKLEELKKFLGAEDLTEVLGFAVSYLDRGIDDGWVKVK